MKVCYHCRANIDGDGWLFPDGATEVCIDCHSRGATGICLEHKVPLAECFADGFEYCESIFKLVSA